MENTTIKIKEIEPLMENVSAISAEFHKGDGYQEFYDAYKDHFHGFPGIWSYCVALAEGFTKAEKSLKVVAGNDYEWIEAINSFVVNALYSEPMGYEEIVKSAKTSIKGAM